MENAVFIASGVSPSQEEIFKSIIKNLYDMLDGNLELVDVLKGAKLGKLIPYIKISKINLYESKDWDEDVDTIDEFMKSKSYKTLFIVRLPTKSRVMHGKYKQTNKLLDKIDMRVHSIERRNFNQERAILRSFLIPCIGTKYSNIVQVFLDSQECRLDRINLFKKNKKYAYHKFYILNKEDLNYFPLYERVINQNKVGNKENEFCFMCTAVTPDRQWIKEYKEYLEETYPNVCRIFIEKERRMKQSEYYKMLSKSKFSLIIPSYDITTFSAIRLFECIKVDCLPIVLKSVNLFDLYMTFPHIYKIVKKYLILSDLKLLDKKIKLLMPKYMDIINQIKQTDEYKQVMDINLIKKQYREEIKNG